MSEGSYGCRPTADGARAGMSLHSEVIAMTSEQTTDGDEDGLTRLSRVIFDEMNVEPRRMNVAIDLAREFLTEIRQELIRQNRRTPVEGESPPPC